MGIVAGLIGILVMLGIMGLGIATFAMGIYLFILWIKLAKRGISALDFYIEMKSKILKE